jgi:glycosyltransferase involved in cell wall biosynthesis
MHIWIVTIGEPLPTDGGEARLLRHGLLANVLCERGHKVTWWTSTFDHQQKRHRAGGDVELKVSPNYCIRLLRGTGYRKNVSLARLNDHRLLAKKYRKRIQREAPPDLILCSFPTAGLCNASTQFGRRHGVPVVADVRDMWPDIFYDVLPRTARGLARVACRPMVWQSAIGLREANVVVSMSEACLNWGLTRGQRVRNDRDLVFPLAYERPRVSDALRSRAQTALVEAGVNPGKLTCWFIGTLGRRYDVATILEAARQLNRSGREDIQFVISGDGDQRARLRERAADLPNVLFTGWVKTPQIAALLELADIGIVAINDDLPTLPNKLFEYFSAGIPVVSCASGEAVDLINAKACGLNYLRGDPQSLAAAITTIASDPPLRERLGSNTLRAFEAEFSAAAVYGRMASHLEHIAASGVCRQRPKAA